MDEDDYGKFRIERVKYAWNMLNFSLEHYNVKKQRIVNTIYPLPFIKLSNNYLCSIQLEIKWMGCSPDTVYEIRALTAWGRARYLSVTEVPHNIESLQVSGEETFRLSETWRPERAALDFLCHPYSAGIVFSP